MIKCVEVSNEMTNGRYAGFLCRNLHTSALLTQHKSLKHNKLKIEQKSFII